MNVYHVDSLFNQRTFIPGYLIQHGTGSFLQLYGAVYQETISIFKLGFSFKGEQIISFPTGEISSLGKGLGAVDVSQAPLSLISHFKTHTQHPCHCSVAPFILP